MGPPLWGGASSDAQGSSRTLLFHGDGADGSTTFVDSSLLGISGVRTGNPEIKTDAGAYNGASMRYYQGASSYVSFTRPSAFISSGVYTIEFTIELLEPTGGSEGTNFNTVFSMWDGVGARTRIVGFNSGFLSFFGNIVGSIDLTGAGRKAVMISRDGTTVCAYIGGTRVYSAVASPGLPGLNIATIGCVNEVIANATWSHGARIEEVRITNGLCLQSGASYVVQTSAFPNP